MEAGSTREHFKHFASYAVAPFRGLIRIGRRPERDRSPARQSAQLVPESHGVERLGVDLALELLRIAQLHELVGVTRVAILAAELTAPVGVDRPAERHTRAIATSQIGAGAQLEILDAPLR